VHGNPAARGRFESMKVSRECTRINAHKKDGCSGSVVPKMFRLPSNV
jgi:hypothetical protein